MNADLFEQWLRRCMPDFIQAANGKRCVIVMDNASYHSRRRNPIPTKANSKKQALIDYLNNHNIPLPPKMTKVVLDQIIQQYLSEHPLENRCEAELIAEEFGATILRLPPYHCEFNP